MSVEEAGRRVRVYIRGVVDRSSCRLESNQRGNNTGLKEKSHLER